MQADSLSSEPPGKSKNTRVGSLSLLQRIFLIQESNWGLLHCKWLLYQLSYQGCMNPLYVYAYPFPLGPPSHLLPSHSSRSSQALSWAPWAVQHVPTSCLLYTWWCIYVNPNLPICHTLPFLGGASGKEPTCQGRSHKWGRFDPWVGKILWKRAWQPTPVFLLRESHGQRSLVAYSPWVTKSWTLPRRLSMHPFPTCSPAVPRCLVCTSVSLLLPWKLAHLYRFSNTGDLGSCFVSFVCLTHAAKSGTIVLLETQCYYSWMRRSELLLLLSHFSRVRLCATP